MKLRLILALLLCAPCFGQTDQYGGYTAMPSPNPSTGQFRTEKFGNKWMFVDPANNGYFMIGTYALNEDTSVDDMGNSYFNRTNAKYGDTGPTWGPAQLNRTMAWGFNSVGPYASSYVQPVTTDSRWPADHSNPVKVPFVGLVRPAYYGMSNQNNWAPQPIKNMMYAVSSFYNGYNSSNGVADYYDGNFDTFMTNELANDSGLAPIKASAYKQYLIGMNADDGDEMYGFGDGPDFVNGHNNANLGWIVLTMSPLQTANSAMRNLTSSGGTGFVYTDTTVYSKAALVTQLTTKYGTIGALNTAWGSTYTTFGSSGTTRAAESVGTGNGSALTFSHTLANAAVSKYSLQIFVSGVAVGGDIGNGTVWGPNLSGTVTYSSGAMSLTFTAGHAPANAAPITASYVQNGWGIGTGLLDEDGRVSHQGWVGTDFVFMTNVNANTTTDLNAFLAAIAGHYFSSCNTHLKAWIPGVLYLGPDTLGTWSAPSNRNVLTAAASYIDVMAMGLGGSPEDLSQTMLDFIHTYYGDKPFYAGQFRVANPDSALYRYTQSSQFSTQALRGTDYYNSVTTYPAAAYTATGTQPYIGILWWQYLDNWGEKNDWGLVSLSDNAYDGNEAVMGGGGINCAITHTCTVTCSAPLATYKCGGEERNYGNVITSVTSAHKQIQTALIPSRIPTNGTAPRYYSNSSTANSGAITAPFNASSPVNAVGYDTSLNPAPMDAYTRLTDSTTFGGASVGNNSCGGGAFERMWSANNDRVFVAGSGGFAYALELNLTGTAGQLTNTGALPTSDRIICPVATSFVNDNVVYNVVLNASPPYTAITSNTFPGNNTHTSTVLADLTSGTLCPGLPSGQPTHIGGFAVALNDTRFSMNMSFTGGQDTDPWGVVWDKTLGCQVVNASTGSYWAWNLAGTPSTTATGTLASASTCSGASDCNCWGGTIHNSQMSGDGTVLSLSMYVLGGNWTHGVCSAYSNAAQRSDYLIDSSITQWGHDSINPAKGAQYYDGHPAFGTSKVVGGDNNVATTHVLANIEGFTQWQTIPACATESHLSLPNPFGLDNYPVIFTSSDLPLSCGTNAAPVAFGNEMFAGYQNAVNQSWNRFGHTFSCNPANALYPSCGGNSDFYFGSANGIVTVSNDGNWAILDSGMLLGLGLDSSSEPRADAFLVHIGAPPASSLFGFTETSTAPSNFPTVPFKMQRIWDSPPLQWPSINTSAGVFNFTNLDTMLAQDLANSVPEVMYTLARTPPWITSNPTDTTCSYQLPVPGGGHGECYPPTDLNADGSGTDATWKAWITAIATHANNATYLQTHAHIRYWEIWNEPDATQYWMGSFAQLSRLTEDANCIITGRGVIHQSGNGSATTCTATAIDSTAQIVMSSGHASSAAVLTYAQNQLYCNATTGIPSYQLPCPNPATATAAALDIINFHLKPGNASGNNCPAPSTPCTVETAMAQYVVKIDGILQTAELAKPLWDGEMSYAIQGFVAPYNTPDMCSSFVARMYMTMWSLNISGSALYTWDNLKAQGPQCLVAYQQTYGYIQGSTLTVPCTSAGTVWSCTLTQNGVARLVMWDSSQACTGTSCPTSPQTVPNQWGAYQDMTSVSTPQTISNHSVPVGIKPVILQIGGSASGPAPATALFATVSRNQQVNSVGGSK